MECEHKNLENFKEPYSDDKAQRLTSQEVRKLWPRRKCPDCGVIIYESFIHMIAGDY